MSSGLFGEQHQALVKWLTGSWLQNGPPIAVIQGFPGLGKTAIAEHLVAEIANGPKEITTVHFDCPDSTATLVDDLVLRLAEELDAKGDSGVVEDLNNGVDADGVFRKLLALPRLIVLDEAQRLMGEADNTPRNQQIGRILENLSRATGSPGRVLLLSSREFGDARWEERADITTLMPLKPKNAQEYLRALLAKDNRTDAIPPGRIADVASWLGGNPRAIHLLASALRRETLDYLIALAPEAWEARDRHVSPQLLRAFETRVLTRAVSQLDEPTELFLRRLAVFRQPLHRKALDAVATTEIDIEASRDDLISRYIIELRQGHYHVHPIVRDTLLSQLAPRQKRSAHQMAGDYFARAFRAKQLVGKAEALGARFVEARYHFTQAESERDLREIAERFEHHLRSRFNFTSPVPKAPEELEEQIALLSALLKDRGPHAMEYYLARCLLARGRHNDARLALPHVRRSTGPRSPASAWIQRIQVEAVVCGAEEAVKAAREGIALVPPTQSLFSLYQAAAEILARDGKADEAITLLREGIGRPNIGSLSSLYQAAAEILARDGKVDKAITLLREGLETPNIGSLSSLYQATAEILARDGKVDEAVTLLREGIGRPNIGSLSSLYQAAAEILARDGKANEAVTLLREGIKAVPPTQSLFSLYQAAAEILARDGKADEAVTLLREGIGTPNIGSLSSLYQASAEILARDGKADEAVTLLRKGIKAVPPTQSLFSLYQASAEILARDGKADEAVTLLREGLETPNIGSLSSLYQAAAEILARDGKVDKAVTLLGEGIKAVPPTQNLFSLYQAAAEILARDGKAAEAVTLLREGIKAVPPTRNLFSLYQAAAEILARDGKGDEAVTLLREGIKAVPLTQNLFSLYQVAAEILARDDKVDEAVTLLREGIDRIGGGSNAYKLTENAILLSSDIGRADLIDGFALGPQQKVLADVVSHISQDSFAAAAKLAKSGLEEFPAYSALIAQGIFASVALGHMDQARYFIGKWSGEMGAPKGSSIAWTLALFEMKSGDTENARRYLDAYSGRTHADEEVSIETLLGYWIASCRELGSALSYHFPRIPTSISGLDHTLIRHHHFSHHVGGESAHSPQKADTVDVDTHQMRKAESQTVSVLAVATEWSSGRGGLSTFNRQLCIALSQAGAKVACVVLDATAGEIAAAEDMGVTLVEAPHGTGLSEEQRLINRPIGLEGFEPNLLIGHGRITGPAAAALQANHYQSARRVHFVHMAPDEIEPYKVGREDQAGMRAQDRTGIEEDLGRTAARVVAVGPRLHGRFTTYLAGYEDLGPPLRFDPGFDVAKSQKREPPGGDPWHVLLLGRAEDVHLKGLDTAASAVAKAARERPADLPRLELVIRGAKPDEMDELRSNLAKEVGTDRLSIVVRAFTVSDEELGADLRRASLVLMPSRAEGFGLVGVEAIVAGTPVLISAESGLGQLLREQLPAEQASRLVVGMDGDDQQLRDRWAGAIDRMLADREASFGRAAEIRELMATKKTWRDEAARLLAAMTE